MVYNTGIEEKREDCCGRCKRFLGDGYTVGELNSGYANSPYADTEIGRCPLHDKEDGFNGVGDCVNAVRWATHTPCLDFEEN